MDSFILAGFLLHIICTNQHWEEEMGKYMHKIMILTSEQSLCV